MLIELIRGGATLTALCMIESYVLRYWRTDPKTKQVYFGLVYGLFCLFGMYAPINLAPGVIFDARSVVLAVAGLFGGPVVAAISVTIAGAYRLYLGGAGAGVGVAVILTSALSGLVYRYCHQQGWIRINFINLLGFGFVVHAVCTVWFLFLPDPVVKKLFETLVLPFLAVFTLATPLVGLMLQDTRNRLRTEDALKKTTAELGESENLFRALFDNSPNGITLKDNKGNFLLANKTLAQWYGKEVKDIIGKNVDDVMSPDSAQRIHETEKSILASHKEFRDEAHYSFLGGQPRYLSVYKKRLELSQDRPPIILTILTDITHRKEMETSMMAAMSEAEYANQAKSEFLATMSHELRTPLNAIIGFSDIIRSELFGPVGSKAYVDYASDIHASGDHLLSLINDILDISSIEAGKYLTEHVDVDLADVVSDCLKTLKLKISAKKLEVSVNLHANAQTVHADRRAVFQVLLNLLANAVKFSEPGGALAISSETVSRSVKITIYNSSGVIPPDVLSKITEPFTKANPNPHLTQEGTGLGLAIVKALVEGHQGRLDIISDESNGTTVMVTLPLLAREPDREWKLATAQTSEPANE